MTNTFDKVFGIIVIVAIIMAGIGLITREHQKHKERLALIQRLPESDVRSVFETTNTDFKLTIKPVETGYE